MLRSLQKPLIPAFIGFGFFLDENDKPADKFIDQQRQDTSNEGWQRVKNIFKTDEFGRITPEFSYISQAGFMGLFSGFVYGGFLGSRKNYLDFMERNQASSFISHMEAKKKLQDSVTMGFAKYGFRFSWRLGYFSATYTSIVTMISVYRGKSSVIEHTIAGATTGALYKTNMGLRGMAAGAIVGGVLGTVAGTVTYGILKMTGTTMDELRLYQHHWSSDRKEMIHEATKKQVEGSDFSDTSEIMVYHDSRLPRGTIDLKKVKELIEKEQAEIKAQEEGKKPDPTPN